MYSFFITWHAYQWHNQIYLFICLLNKNFFLFLLIWLTLKQRFQYSFLFVCLWNEAFYFICILLFLITWQDYQCCNQIYLFVCEIRTFLFLILKLRFQSDVFDFLSQKIHISVATDFLLIVHSCFVVYHEYRAKTLFLYIYLTKVLL